jgi:hypothetical protein
MARNNKKEKKRSDKLACVNEIARGKPEYAYIYIYIYNRVSILHREETESDRERETEGTSEAKIAGEGDATPFCNCRYL